MTPLRIIVFCLVIVNVVDSWDTQSDYLGNEIIISRLPKLMTVVGYPDIPNVVAGSLVEICVDKNSRHSILSVKNLVDYQGLDITDFRDPIIGKSMYTYLRKFKLTTVEHDAKYNCIEVGVINNVKDFYRMIVAIRMQGTIRYNYQDNTCTFGTMRMVEVLFGLTKEVVQRLVELTHKIGYRVSPQTCRVAASFSGIENPEDFKNDMFNKVKKLEDFEPAKGMTHDVLINLVMERIGDNIKYARHLKELMINRLKNKLIDINELIL